MIVQYFSKRLRDEFIDAESYRRWKEDQEEGKGRQHETCSQCSGPSVIVSITFGAPFCSPSCYLKYLQGYLDWCDERRRADEEAQHCYETMG